jgi:hypothetical protein
VDVVEDVLDAPPIVVDAVEDVLDASPFVVDDVLFIVLVVPALPPRPEVVLVALQEPAAAQLPLQSSCPIGQAQTEAEHDCPEPQTRPQPPQFCGSDAVFVQTPLQLSVPTAHEQVPATQD